jgi:Zn-dependent protease/CBS domain-containing protein
METGEAREGDSAMKWSWKLGRIAGIDVFMHATFLLLIGWVAFSYYLQGGDLATVLAGVGFILALFACVVLHEFGHALTARRYGIQTRDITLLPIGGVARLERMPENPVHELRVALAGPAVNVVIAAGLFGWLALTGTLEPLTSLSLTGGSFLERLMVVNLFLVGFNMLPAFPMDGGRVLRALLATRMEYTHATHLAAGLGQGIALLLGLFGLFSNPFLVFTALFVWIGAAQESSMVQMRSALGGIPVSRAMVTQFETLTPADPISRAVQLILAGSQHDFPVVDGDAVVGVLTRADLLAALAHGRQNDSVRDVMRRNFELIDPGMMLERASAQLQTCECHTLPVVRNGQLVGLVTMDNIGEFLMVRAALEAATRQRPPSPRLA